METLTRKTAATGVYRSVQTHKLADADFGNQWLEEALNRWDYAEYLQREEWRSKWISFDCAHYEAGQRRVYLGLTSFANNIFWAWDRDSEQFLDLGYAKIANRFDAKFHRSLEYSRKDNCLYAAVALLHDVDKFYEAPGSPIIKCDLKTGTISKLGIPLSHVYVQSIALDDQRDTIYGLCFPPEKLFAFNVKTHETRDLGLIGTGIAGMTQTENLVLDDKGCVWSAWSITRAWQNSPGPDAMRFCKYDPRQERMIFFKEGLPHPDGRYGTVRAEGLFNFHDGFIYASGASGSLYRIDPETGNTTFMFTPTTDGPSRLTSLVKTEDGIAYGVTGREGRCQLMRVDYRRGTFEKLGFIQDEEGNALWQCHHIVAAEDGVFFLCENDNPYRSSYLWEVTL
jgi:hypothetical protein